MWEMYVCVAWARDVWHSWPNHPDGWLALCPLPSTDEFQFQAQVPPGSEREPSLELFQQVVKERAGDMEIELTDAPWLSLYRANVRMAARYRVGRVFLAGRRRTCSLPCWWARHEYGDTGCVPDLGWKLGSVLGGAPDALLDTYEEERLPVAANVLGLSTRLYRQITSQRDEDKVRRDAVTLQLGITYKEMSLSRNCEGVHLKVTSGDRAPDAPGLNTRNEPMRLFDVFRGPHFTLLRLFGPDHSVNGRVWPSVKRVDVSTAATADYDAEVYLDSFGHFAAAYGGGKGEYMLVRPDGYIAWVGLEENLPDLDRYLTEFCRDSSPDCRA